MITLSRTAGVALAAARTSVLRAFASQPSETIHESANPSSAVHVAGTSLTDMKIAADQTRFIVPAAKALEKRPMHKFCLTAKSSVPVMAALAALIGTAPTAFAGDLGDGGYGARAYGRSQPYYSGQDDYADRNGQDDDDDNDDGDHAYNRHNSDDDDDDDNIIENDDDHDEARCRRRDHHHTNAYRYNGSTKDDGYAPQASIVRPHRGGCVQGWQVKQRLIGEGWSSFRLNNFGQGIAVVRATRVATGRPFELRIDGCTGETLSSRPADYSRYSYRD